MIIHCLFLCLAISVPTLFQEVLSFDFRKSGAGEDWRAINDGVMGGLSEGILTMTDSSMIFSGQLSFKNNGGFTSFRAPFGSYDLSGYTNVTINYRSSGPSFDLMLELTDVFWLPHFRQPLTSTQDKWQEVTFPLAELRAYRLTDPTNRTASADDLKKFIRIGFISSEKSTEPFRFEIGSLTFH